MKRIMVANPKGGCGKSTLSTHIAAWFAWQEQIVMLGDIDRQQSSHHWLNLRPAPLPHIGRWEIEDDKVARPPKGTQVVVLDTPAGLHGKALKHALGMVDKIVVPLVPSAFDMWASAEFFEQLAEMKAVRREEVAIGVVGMRVNARTQMAAQLDAFLQPYGLPMITQLRETQLYVQTIQRGLTIFDLPHSRTERDREQWGPLLDWLQKRKD